MKLKGLFNILLEDHAEAESSTPKRGRLVLIFSTILAVVLLYLVLRSLDWRMFFQTIKNAHYAYLPIIFLWSSLSFLLRALRLRILLISENDVSIPAVFWANMAGYLGNNILPARAGELIRATYLGRTSNISASFALAVGLVERLMDLIALVLIGSFALSLTGATPPVFQDALKVVSFLGVLGLVGIVALPRFDKVVKRSIDFIPFLAEQHKIKLDTFLQHFLFGLKSLHGFKRTVQFVCFTCSIWLMDAVGAMFLGFILKIPLLLQHAFVLLAALGLSSAIPSTPGYIGVYQYVAVTTLAPFEISRGNALAYILISQILGYIIVIFWGVLSIWHFNKHYSSSRK